MPSENSCVSEHDRQAALRFIDAIIMDDKKMLRELKPGDQQERDHVLGELYTLSEVKWVISAYMCGELKIHK